MPVISLTLVAIGKTLKESKRFRLALECSTQRLRNWEVLFLQSPLFSKDVRNKLHSEASDMTPLFEGGWCHSSSDAEELTR